MECLKIGTVTVIDESRASGKLRPDGQPDDIDWVDRALAADIVVGSKVCYDKPDAMPATNLILITSENVITTPIPGDLTVGKEEFVELQTTVGGSVTVTGGAFKMSTSAAVVTGDVTGKKGAAIAIENQAKVKSDVNLKDAISISMEQGIINGDIDVKNSNGTILLSSATIGGTATIKNSSGLAISSGTVNMDLDVKANHDISIDGLTVTTGDVTISRNETVSIINSNIIVGDLTISRTVGACVDKDNTVGGTNSGC